MTSQTSGNRWRRTVTGAVAGSALAAGLLAGVAAPVALADPAADANANAAATADTPPAPQMTADEALAIIDKEYDTGSGGGQISQLIHSVLQLRAQGFKPSNANRDAIVAALDKKPDQMPLIDALKNTLSYQRKLQARSNGSQSSGGISAGINQTGPGQVPIPGAPGTPGISLGPNNSGINVPVG
ncbi:hypothetical protein A5784_10830 [Mycobacterium sp. 852013-50091_SCH5140682]|uniref:hypothetical protein n=1 Tax=Mycobacterium sp. 852013-50091_SCH5140682 TaxID=1834109 RepID=UPI0007EB9734|nr:hypothetical protein [Mycobacterium sp. 852013-50091_SCH5140682]OBC05862.1 hypothetical protein A5784_10830 [Mycobacterium sp. 852013-50091_SCH5140682]